ncbi:hypothetical protein FHS14_001484 [Paenibacillus baekrokdamisoli]|nr:hypothetical protein [Paenibacillus baekrokdamisoli]MBB3068508.1 hypothetical protein [Paenibacillus baekrokdamisoli]
MKEITIELHELGRIAGEKARAEAWAAGLPYSYGVEGKVILVYPDGRKTEVVYDPSAERNEVPYVEKE